MIARQLLAIGVGCCLSLSTAADTLGFEVGAYQWQQNYDGTVRSGITDVDVENDLGLDDESNLSYYAVLEHPVPMLPNIKLQHTELDISETATLSRTIDFEGNLYPITATVNTDSDLSHTDVTLYYELLDNWVELDLGLTARTFGDSVKLSSPTTGTEGEVELDETIPLLYAAARFELPMGFYLGADINGLSYDDYQLLDYRVHARWQADFGLGVELGWRSLDIDYEDGDEDADLTIDGAYLGAFYHF